MTRLWKFYFLLSLGGLSETLLTVMMLLELNIGNPGVGFPALDFILKQVINSAMLTLVSYFVMKHVRKLQIA